MESCKSFMVAGDLIIDHTIFVDNPQEPFEPTTVPEEKAYTVVGRQSMAGGAANTARILAALYPEGKTFLWGILGDSHWGTFRKILEDSQAIDGVFNNIELRGVQDETNATMNTITRLIVVRQGQLRAHLSREVRFDDSLHTHVSDDKRESLLYHLWRIHHDKRIRLNSIIINDLDKGSMTPRLVAKIATFAKQENIPLFVDPQLRRDNYENIEGTAILPNLQEWCYLVGQNDNLPSWRNRIKSKTDLIELAEISLHYLGNFRYHIIKCDEIGAVIIAPKPGICRGYDVYLVKPAHEQPYPIQHLLGPGDLMTGVIAAEYDDQYGTSSLLSAFKKANLTVACYREMPYQRMPPRNTVLQQWPKDSEAWQPKPNAWTTAGLLFLPREKMVSLKKAKTAVPLLISVNGKFKEQVNQVIECLRKESKSSKARSIILSAPPGSGKTLIADALKTNLGGKLGFLVKDAKDVRLDKVKSPETFIDALISKHPNENILIIVDEALKQTYGKVLKNANIMTPLLNASEKNNVRFLFIDADFDPKLLDSQVTRRCHYLEICGLKERPEDIPYILGNQVLTWGKKYRINRLEVEARVLRALIDWVITDSEEVRGLSEYVKTIYSKAIQDHRSGGTLVLKESHLTPDMKRFCGKGRYYPEEKYFYEK